MLGCGDTRQWSKPWRDYEFKIISSFPPWVVEAGKAAVWLERMVDLVSACRAVSRHVPHVHRDVHLLHLLHLQEATYPPPHRHQHRLFVYHLIIFPVLTVKENPVRAFLPVVFIVTLSTLRALLKAAKIIPSHFILFLSKNFFQPGGNLTPL